MMGKKNKLAQRSVSVKGYDFSVGLTGNLGYISITDRNLYPEGDSRDDRHNLGFNSMMIPLMSREDLIDLNVAIKEVLKNSK